MDKLYFKNLFSREKIFKIQFVYGFVFIYLIFVMYMCCQLSGLPPLNFGIGSEIHSFPHFSSMSSIAPIFSNTWLFHYFLPFLVQTGFRVGECSAFTLTFQQERVGQSQSLDSFRLTVVGVMDKLDVLDTLNIYVYHHGYFFTTAITILLTIAQ